MAHTGEAVVVDGLATRVQRPSGWANQKVVYDAKRHAHTAQGLTVSFIWGDLLWVDGGRPGGCHEHELVELSGLAEVLDGVEVASLLDQRFRGWPRPASTGTPRSGTAAPRTGSATGSGPTTACRRGCARVPA
jgi:DDE superfamily endonuclease